MTRFRAPVRVVAIVAAIVTTLVASAGAPSSVDAQSEGACDDNEGITVVVDFQELGGGVNVRCASGSVTSGLDALDLADVAWEGTLRFPAFVCRIAGLPTPGDEACANTPPATAYWSYWIAERGGEWCYANVGPTGRTPPPGSIEGWSFALDKAEADVPPPGLDVPAALAGETPNPLRSSDCTTPEESGSSVTTTAGSSITSTTSSSTSTSTSTSTSSSTTTSSTTSSTIASASGGESEGVSTTSSTVAASSSTSAVEPVSDLPSPAPSSTLLPDSVPDAETTTTGPGDQTANTNGLDDGDELASPQPSLAEAVTGAEAESAAASEVGTVDLSDDRRGDGGFGLSSALAIAAIAGVVVAGVVTARRRTRPLRVET